MRGYRKKKMSAAVTKISAEYITNLLKNTKRFDRCLKQLKILNLSDGKCSAELKVEEEHLSPWDTLHGGMSALLLDNVSTWALQTHKNADDVKAAVSVEINMTFIKAAKEGEEIQIDANTLRAGKSLAFLEMFIKNKSTGELLVKGGQTKYLVRRQ
ncbi:acyl-coenzyme A thioesterase 13 [Leptinotarsa decemlineata]|uniref:acyl-coenzyme A thioesterase 13 n=1 Tax=Leptinotarsa decemlineata TaxID=7539 RepID=UPI003D308E5F